MRSVFVRVHYGGPKELDEGDLLGLSTCQTTGLMILWDVIITFVMDSRVRTWNEDNLSLPALVILG